MIMALSWSTACISAREAAVIAAPLSTVRPSMKPVMAPVAVAVAHVEETVTKPTVESSSSPLAPPAASEATAPSTADVAPATATTAPSDGSEGKCTPFDKPAPLSPFDAAKLDGVWFEIATSVGPRSTDEKDCTCSFMNFSKVAAPQASQSLEGRALFDLYASCNKLTVNGEKIRKIGQAIQIDATSDSSSFEMFLVDATLQNGQLTPVQPPAGSPGQPASAQPPAAAAPLTPRGQTARANPQRTAARPPVAPTGQRPTLKEMLNPNLVTLKVLGSGEKYTHVIMAGPCQESVWVMSRHKTMSDDIYQSLLAGATAAGIDVTKIGLSFTKQDGCAAPLFP